MIYKPYGNTDKMVSVIGFGGMRFKDDDSLEDAAEIVRKANELGINYFDTAHFYCNSRSEAIFGEAFKNMPGDFYVSTKTMPKIDPTAEHVRKRLDASLKIMGVDKINFLNIWCIMDMDQYRHAMIFGGAYEGALKAKEEGLVDHIVFSTHCSGDDIETIVNEGCFEGVTLGYNVLNFPYREKGIKAAHAKGMGVVTMNPLGGGLIPQNPQYFDFIRNTAGEEETVVQSALRFIIAQKEITVALVGFSSLEELEEDVKATEIQDMAQMNVEFIKTNISKELNQLCTGCKYCDECPQGINIPVFMDSYNMYILEKEYKSVEDRLNWHWGISGEALNILQKCTDCGKCEKLCTQKLSIMDRLKEISNHRK